VGSQFAQNVYLDQDSNLTFWCLGFIKVALIPERSSNYPDPTLETIPSLFTLSPGINYGNAFFDFGLAVKNAVYI
jgi:hypothetical protein